MLVFNTKEGRLLDVVKSWQFDNEEKNFGSSIEAIVPAGNRLYVAERQSRIHVFELPDLTYVTCIEMCIRDRIQPLQHGVNLKLLQFKYQRNPNVKQKRNSINWIPFLFIL